MHIARYEIDGRIHFGALEGNRLKRFSGSPFTSSALTGDIDQLDRAHLLCPVEAPRIFGAGLNYVSHIEEMKLKRPTVPLLFMKPTTAVIGPDEPIVYPRESKDVHFEGELAVVIGRRARRASKNEALDAVFGYTCANDVSERAIQRAEMATGHLLMGKAYDTFCPMGPVIATGLDPRDLLLETRVNGKVRQSVRTSDLLFSVAELITYISQAVTLLPGDVILTGTPSGVGPIEPGDAVDITIEGIGTLHNPVIAEPALAV
jgi:2-keto-4-pentenoate hydratase/2-oxohepta-3-ene-1,7-dioic acid hydratase in catechol pathway